MLVVLRDHRIQASETFGSERGTNRFQSRRLGSGDARADGGDGSGTERIRGRLLGSPWSPKSSDPSSEEDQKTDCVVELALGHSGHEEHVQRHATNDGTRCLRDRHHARALRDRPYRCRTIKEGNGL